MTRFTRTLTAALLVAICVPAQAAECPIPTIYPSLNADGSCLSLRCHGMRLLREAYQRGEIATVHLSNRSECSALSTYDISTGETVAVPCTWDHNDNYRPN